MAFTEQSALYDLRIRMNWTYAELAKRLKLSPQAVHNMLNKRTYIPSDRVLFRVQHLLRTHASDVEATA